MLHIIVYDLTYERKRKTYFSGVRVVHHACSKTLPEGYPLKLVDAHGTPLFVGDSVRLLSVKSCAKGLPQEDQERLLSYVGGIRTILEVDRYGFIWLVFNEKNKSCGADFCLEPQEVRLEKPAKDHMKMNWPSIFGKKEPVRK